MLTAPTFTPRLVEGPEHAPRVMFLDPNAEPSENIFDRVRQTLEFNGEVAFAIKGYAIVEAYRRLNRVVPTFELAEYGAPDVVRCIGHAIHAVFAATLPPAWLTGQVRSYALSSSSPTIGWGTLAHQYLTGLGASASNGLLWRPEVV